MAEKLSVKENGLAILRRQLAARARKRQQGFVVLSSATDAYLPLEEKEMLTRGILELLLEYRFPVHIITRSTLVLRDLDLLQEINEQAVLPPDMASYRHKAMITFSFSTIDPVVGRQFEPGAPDPSQRLQALKKCADEGFMTGVSLMPLLPFIGDRPEQLSRLYAAFHEHGARYVFPASVTLWGEEAADSKQLVMQAVQKYYPQYAEHYRRLFTGSSQVPAAYNAALQTAAAVGANRYGLLPQIPFE